MKPKTTKQVFDFFPGMWKIARRVTVEIPEQNAIANGYRSHLFKKVVKKEFIGLRFRALIKHHTYLTQKQ